MELPGEILSEKAIRRYLRCDGEKISFIIKEEVGSTNDEAKILAQKGAEEITVVLAESQTKGRGRLGRKFFSPKSTGCYMSILLRPRYTSEECTLLTTLAAVAVAEAIEKLTNKKTDIKWINDVYIDGKKVSGILTESGFAKDIKYLDYAVVGIGVNIALPDGGFPKEIESIAGSITAENTEIKNRLIAEILNAFIADYYQLEKKHFLQRYKKKLMFIGEGIKVLQGESSFSARAIDIDDMCRLIVETSDGETLTLNSGEISVRKG